MPGVSGVGSQAAGGGGEKFQVAGYTFHVRPGTNGTTDEHGFTRMRFVVGKRIPVGVGVGIAIGIDFSATYRSFPAVTDVNESWARSDRTCMK